MNDQDKRAVEGMEVKLVKEPDNEVDKEAIKVEMPGIGHIYSRTITYTFNYWKFRFLELWIWRMMERL